MSKDLDQLVEAARRGEADALRTVYEKLAPKVFGFLLMRGSEDPDGLTNDVFLRVLPRLGAITGGWSGLQALVFTVAHGRMVDEIRGRSRRPRIQGYDAAEDPRTQPSAETTAINRIALQEAFDVLELLPEDQRAVITLRIVGDLTISETATAIGRSEAAVKKLQRRGLESLRRLLTAGAPQQTWEG